MEMFVSTADPRAISTEGRDCRKEAFVATLPTAEWIAPAMVGHSLESRLPVLPSNFPSAHGQDGRMPLWQPDWQ
jgi:hypothetical protein